MRASVVAAALILCVALPLSAVRIRKKKRRPKEREAVVKVVPSDAIESRVKQEIEKVDAILSALDPSTMLESGYLASAVYYHEGFLTQFPEDKPDADPARRIVAHATRALTTDRKASFIGILRDIWSECRPQPDPSPFVAPVSEAAIPKKRRRRTHEFAIDMFVPEGSPVHSVSRGVVLLSQGTWDANDLFSTASQRGGNSVIIFDPDRSRFYRYAHLETATAIPGACIAAGHPIGTVGHTGLNASRPRHGRHLHFESNQYDGQTVHPLTQPELRQLLSPNP